MAKPFVIVTEEPKVVELKDDKDIVFGKIKEITSRAVGAQGANLAEVTLFGPDIIHRHRENEETYISQGSGVIFVNEEMRDFSAGTRVIITPGTLHAAKPKRAGEALKFLCLSGPPFDQNDVYDDPRGRNW